MSILMWLFIFPIISALIILGSQGIVPWFRPFRPGYSSLIKSLAFLLSLIPLVMLLWNHTKLIGMEVNYFWIHSLGINFFLKIDYLTLIFLYLTAIVIPISILVVNQRNFSHANLYYSLILFLQALLIGFFAARDLAVFTIFWEAMLLPLYFIISYWGGEHRHEAALKFLVYMIAGSVLMIAAILFLYFASSSSEIGTFNLDTLKGIAASTPSAEWIFLIFMLAFAVKTPLFPFHAWLPDAYYEAPNSGTILLSAILSKAGIYGIARIGIELFPQLLKEWSPILLALAIIGVFYGGLAAWMQNDFKKLIAYSSFSHVNFILAGLFVWHQPAQAGAILQSINHAIVITALFLVSAWLENILKTTSMSNVTGLFKYFPNLGWLTMFIVLASVALPGTNNFIGELMILFGLFGQNPWIAVILGGSIILSAIYMLHFMQKVYFGNAAAPRSSWHDIGTKELLIAAPLVILILLIGIYPKPVLNIVKPAIESIQGVLST
jgi:NADH-quinone oxidoreductase subunit M